MMARPPWAISGRGTGGGPLAGVADFFRTPEALYRKDDKGAYRAYLRNSLKGR